MDSSTRHRLRIALAGIGPEHLALLPGLFRDPRVEVVWVCPAAADSALARLSAVFSYPVLARPRPADLEGVDLLVSGPELPRPDPARLPVGVRIIDPAAIEAARVRGRFDWDTVLARATVTHPAEGGPEAPEALPDGFEALIDAGRLGSWLCARLEQEAGAEGGTLLVLTRGSRCLGAWRDGGRSSHAPKGSPETRQALRELARSLAAGDRQRLAGDRPGTAGDRTAPGRIAVASLGERDLSIARRCGMLASPPHLLHLALHKGRRAWVVTDAPPESARAAIDRRRGVLQALGRLAAIERMARNWQRLGRHGRRLGWRV